MVREGEEGNRSSQDTYEEWKLLDHVSDFYIKKYPYSPKVQERKRE